MGTDKAEVREAAQALEKDLELSNITDLRRNLLPIVDRLQTNPAERYLILKHGRPQAVLMSFHTYNLVKKGMDLLGAERNKKEAVGEAMVRLRGERSPAQVSSAEADNEAAAIAAAIASEAYTTPISTRKPAGERQATKAASKGAKGYNVGG